MAFNEDSSASGHDEPWIQWFCGLKGHEMFCEVERSYIEDGFNLYGLRACVSNFSDCLDLILDRIGPDDSDDSHLTQSACTLYGLIHARYIITAHGLDAMYNKYAAKEFGTCPLVQCSGQPVLPVGIKDEMGADTVKIFCPKCHQVFHTPPLRSRANNNAGVDGAAFGTTFPHLFLMTFSNLVPDPLPRESTYVPRVFGFRVHQSAQRTQQQAQQQQQQQQVQVQQQQAPVAAALAPQPQRTISSAAAAAAVPEAAPTSVPAADGAIPTIPTSVTSLATTGVQVEVTSTNINTTASVPPPPTFPSPPELASCNNSVAGGAAAAVPSNNNIVETIVASASVDSSKPVATGAVAGGPLVADSLTTTDGAVIQQQPLSAVNSTAASPPPAVNATVAAAASAPDSTSNNNYKRDASVAAATTSTAPTFLMENSAKRRRRNNNNNGNS